MRRLAVLLVLLLPATARAATVSQYSTGAFEGAQIRYTAAPGERNDIHIIERVFTATIRDRVPIHPEGGCVAIDRFTARCPLDIAGVVVRAGDRDDHVVDRHTDDESVVHGGPGDDRITASRAVGGPGDDVLYASSGGWLVGGPGHDRLIGTASGGETFIDGGPAGEHDVFRSGGDQIDPETGRYRDVLRYTGRREPVRVGLAAPLPGQEDTVIGFHNLVGGRGDDTMVGGDGPDTLAGSGGSDDISGGGGDDLLSGNAGTDRVAGGRGDDSIDGGGGADTLTGEAGDDDVVGGGGDDTIDGGDGSDLLTAGGMRSTTIRSADRIDGGPGQDYIAADGGRATVTCGPDRDVVASQPTDIVSPDCEYWSADVPTDRVGLFRLSARVVPVIDDAGAVFSVSCLEECRGELLVRDGDTVLGTLAFAVQYLDDVPFRMALPPAAVAALRTSAAITVTVVSPDDDLRLVETGGYRLGR